MEKRTPHYALARVKELIRMGSYRATATALDCATRDFGFVDPSQLATCLLSLERCHFYKSMTAYADSRLWHDVYHSETEGVPTYIKLQIVENNTVIVSFKQRESN